TFFYAGKFPFASGTFGSLIAIILVAIIFYQPHNFYYDDTGLNFKLGAGYIEPQLIIPLINILAILFSTLGIYTSEIYSKKINKEDPKQIVIDEVAGIFVASALVADIFAILYFINPTEYLIYFSLAGWFFIIIFILFRIFDILKPWHIGYADKNIKGGLGIMLDDIIAGIYTALTFFILFFVAKFSNILEIFITIE
ncbi:MAG: phosphatidylglycerophosphatase A, partial [Rickettsiales bacterium]|nr:phosphatidylglycerophosphatase A [Rickettsiales bacterium]